MRGSGREHGFTLIELLGVMVILSLALVLTVMRVEHLSPKYALRAAAREVGGSIDLARGTAAGRNLRTAVEYDLDAGTYQLYVGRPDRQRADGPWGLEAAGVPKELPRGVRFQSVYAHEKGRGVQSGGVLRVRFDPLGIDGSHIVHLVNSLGKQMSVKYNALLGSCDYADGIAEFEAPPE